MPEKTPSASATRQELVRAAIALFRRQGFAATTVDRICARAAVTKGAFFHYFKSKEEIAVAAVDEWCADRIEHYRADLGNPEDDPLLRLHRLLEGLAESVREPDEIMVCLLGMMSQELAETHENIRDHCRSKLEGWTGFVAELLDEAKKTHETRTEFDSQEVAWMLNSLWQGSLLVGKTRRDPDTVAANFRHARAYIDSLFARSLAA